MKYEQQLTELKNQFTSAKNILIALPSTASIDELAAGLALYLGLNAAQKEVSIVTEDTLKVSHSNLFGVGQVSSSLPKNLGGNFTLTLEGVVASDGTVPALEKLDWYPEGSNLNLVFHVVPGQTFQPARIMPKYSGGGFNLIITIGSASLSGLGNIYNQNQQVFSGVNVVNIDNDSTNTQFGQINIVDAQAATVCEMVAQIIQGLGLTLDGDGASNILSGIYEATSNLTQKTSADTFLAVGLAMQAGGKVTQSGGLQTFVPVAQSLPVSNQTVSQQADFTPLNQVFGFPVQPETASPVNTINSTQGMGVNAPAQSSQSVPQPSPEERPMGEFVGSPTPEIPATPDPDWLTPKIYKGVG